MIIYTMQVPVLFQFRFLFFLIFAVQVLAQQRTLTPPEFLAWLPVTDAERAMKAPVVEKDAGAEVALVSALELELKVRTASAARLAVTDSGSGRFCANTLGTERSMMKIAAFHRVIEDFICMPPVLVERCLSVKAPLVFSIGVRF